MDSPRFRRQRFIGAVVVLLLAVFSVALAAAADLGDEQGLAAFRILVVVFAVAAGGFGVGYLMRGREKDAPLVFAPPRWWLWLIVIFAVLYAVFILLALWTSKAVVFSSATWPVMLAMGVTAMFRPVDKVPDRYRARVEEAQPIRRDEGHE
jgi:peptidoglycan/LPS O-acetylase OafA/YrhL